MAAVVGAFLWLDLCDRFKLLAELYNNKKLLCVLKY